MEAYKSSWKVLEAYKSSWKVLEAIRQFLKLLEASRTIGNPLQAIGNTNLKRCDTQTDRQTDRHTDSCIELRYAQLIKYWGELRLCYPLEFTNLLKHIGIGKHGLYQLRVMHGSGGQHQQGGCAVSLAQHGTERPKGCANNPLKPWKLTKAHGRFWKVMKAHKSFWKLLDSS